MIDTVVKKKYKKIPCKNCISFPVCVAIFKEYELQPNQPYFHYMSYECIASMSHRCSLFYGYIIEEKTQGGDVLKYKCFKRVKKMHDYFYNKIQNEQL